LLHESFLLAKNLDSSGCYTWYKYIKNIGKEVNIELDNLEGLKNLKKKYWQTFFI